MNTICNKKMLMSNCILHIGMNKAGSSAIQEYLQSNNLGAKYYFVKLGSSNHSSYITSLRENPL
ncbi:MAG: hypothetical protein IE909_12760 [Campylobacterales bacterium]|nr:hypothetical protein [Campylobacterales bacterium]